MFWLCKLSNGTAPLVAETVGIFWLSPFVLLVAYLDCLALPEVVCTNVYCDHQINCFDLLSICISIAILSHVGVRSKREGRLHCWPCSGYVAIKVTFMIYNSYIVVAGRSHVWCAYVVKTIFAHDEVTVIQYGGGYGHEAVIS